MATPNLNLDHITGSQNNKETTANLAFDGLDNAMNTVLELAVIGSTFLTPAQLRANATFRLTGTPGSAFDLEIPTGIMRTIAVVNDTDSTVTLVLAVTGGATFDVVAGASSVFATDGEFLFLLVAPSSTEDVRAAGAFMDDEATNLAALKAVDQGLTTTSDVEFASAVIGDATFGSNADDDLTLTTGPTDEEAFEVNKYSGRTVFKKIQEGPTPWNVVHRNYVADATWLISTSATDNSWRSVCWSPELGLFCAVSNTGTGNRVMTSPDGITWTARTSAADIEWWSVCWSPELGLFCTVALSGTGNRVMTSPDGITWTARTSATDNSWRSVCWSPELGLFCVVSSSGVGDRVMTSPDGITWTTRTSAADNGWRSVCWSPELGLFCAVALTGTGNRIVTSPDGITWMTRTSAADNSWLSVCWSPELGLFCAVAHSGTGNRVMTSPDGITWTARTSAADNEWRSVCWSPELGLFCAVADSGVGDRVMTSPDGITWTTRTNATDNSWRSVCWSPELGLFCAVASNGTGNRVMTSVSAYSFSYRS